jgi:proteasome accessory factor A
LSQPLALANGGTATALEIQWQYLELAKKWAESRGLATVGEEVGADVLLRWEAVLTGLESDPESLKDQLDWVAKRSLLEAYRERHGLEWGDARLAAMDLQYHDLRPGKSLAARLGLERITTDAEVEDATVNPPRSTRAWFRGTCLQRWPNAIVSANWDSLVFDLGSDPLRRVPMMEPLRGTAALLEQLVDSCKSPAELIERLSA